MKPIGCEKQILSWLNWKRSAPWLCQEILSIKAMNRIRDKGQNIFQHAGQSCTITFRSSAVQSLQPVFTSNIKTRASLFLTVSFPILHHK